MSVKRNLASSENNSELTWKQAFGKVLQKARMKAGVKTRRVMEQLSGVSRDTLAAWESGRYAANVEDLAEVLKVLGTHAIPVLKFLAPASIRIAEYGAGEFEAAAKSFVKGVRQSDEESIQEEPRSVSKTAPRRDRKRSA